MINQTVIIHQDAQWGNGFVLTKDSHQHTALPAEKLPRDLMNSIKVANTTMP